MAGLDSLRDLAGSYGGWWRLVKAGYGQLVYAIIRPPRHNYEFDDLGQRFGEYNGKVIWRRVDLELRNAQGHKLPCSHWIPCNSQAVKRPCVVYLHGNSGSRVDALECLQVVTSLGFSLFAFDMSGSGRADGRYISLGWYERDDLQVVMEYLRSLEHVSMIGLWGRSMGAATALMHTTRDSGIGCLVLDSPFAALTQVARELAARETAGSIPDIAVQTLLGMIKASVRSKAAFNMDDVRPAAFVHQCYVPALFGYATGDSFVSPAHTKELHSKYAGDKNIIEFEGDHNSHRPPEFTDIVAVFLHRALEGGAQQMGMGGEDVEQLSVRELKARLRARHVDYSDCLEKKDLVKRFNESLEMRNGNSLNISRGPSAATQRHQIQTGQSVV